MSNLAPKAKSTSKKTAKQVGKLVSDQSLETLNLAKKQVTGSYEKTPLTTPENDQVSKAFKDSEVTPEEKERINQEKTKRLQKLEEEIEGYREAREEKEKQLKQQQELEKKQEEERQAKEDEVIEPTSKQPQGLMPGMKGKLSRMKRKTEMRQPPSG